jgi:hypothetical protein
VKVAMLLVVFASACCAREAAVNVSRKGTQKLSPSEVDKVYLSACTGVQREDVVILAFENLLTPQRRLMITNHAVNLAQATVNVGEISDCLASVTVLTLKQNQFCKHRSFKAR